jgi:hypothetical protein
MILIKKITVLIALNIFHQDYRKKKKEINNKVMDLVFREYLILQAKRIVRPIFLIQIKIWAIFRKKIKLLIINNSWDRYRRLIRILSFFFFYNFL